jgi:hypothetical protein
VQHYESNAESMMIVLLCVPRDVDIDGSSSLLWITSVLGKAAIGLREAFDMVGKIM